MCYESFSSASTRNASELGKKQVSGCDWVDYIAIDRYELKGDEEEQIARLAEDGDIYNKLARSLAPEIFGHEDIKKALLLLLVGAPHRKLKDGMKVSG